MGSASANQIHSVNDSTTSSPYSNTQVMQVSTYDRGLVFSIITQMYFQFSSTVMYTIIYQNSSAEDLCREFTVVKQKRDQLEQRRQQLQSKLSASYYALYIAAAIQLIQSDNHESSLNIS